MRTKYVRLFLKSCYYGGKIRAVVFQSYLLCKARSVRLFLKVAYYVGEFRVVILKSSLNGAYLF